ncbi:hypothetical protein BCT86_02650 [Vibrio breoganii]|uniref:Uncharacterized protein n=1 Tax=Vibrio breoganii TaxID=553239 RepID=A0AAN0XXV0_9VIBR|nr:hypothetical protein [Vibrio breoganii]ANO34645.1 hypothetical protein A6E01_15735 [Vibrio breoganii]PML04617.1 hypothetical protein BCT86_02650 [Vibrio breoganii]
MALRGKKRLERFDVIIDDFFRPVPDLKVLKVTFLMHAFYQVQLNTGTLNAASRYQGSTIWANLARVAVCLGGLMPLANDSMLLTL